MEDSKAKGLLSDDYLKSALVDLVIAGSDSTIGNLTWSLLYLAPFPEVQAKIREQLDDVIGHDRPPCLKDKSSLSYLEDTITEIMQPSLFVNVTLLRRVQAKRYDIRGEGGCSGKFSNYFRSQSYSTRSEALKRTGQSRSDTFSRRRAVLHQSSYLQIYSLWSRSMGLHRVNFGQNGNFSVFSWPPAAVNSIVVTMLFTARFGGASRFHFSW